jgi:hypothetical protein
MATTHGNRMGAAIPRAARNIPTNPFVKPGELQTYVAGLEQDFDKQLAKQTAALPKAN